MLPFSKLQQLTVLLSSFSSAQLPCSKSWEHWCWLMSISTHWTIFQMIYFRAYKLQVLSCNLVLLQAYLKMSQALLQTTWNKCAGGCEERSLSNTTQQPTAKLLKHKILSAVQVPESNKNYLHFSKFDIWLLRGTFCSESPVSEFLKPAVWNNKEKWIFWIHIYKYL